jgi:hypothetical protein
MRISWFGSMKKTQCNECYCSSLKCISVQCYFVLKSSWMISHVSIELKTNVSEILVSTIRVDMAI